MFSLIHPWGRHFQTLLFIVSKKWAGTGAFNGECLVHVNFFSEITLASFHAVRAGTINSREASSVCRLVAKCIKGTSGIPENMPSIWWAFLELYVGRLESVFLKKKN